MTNPLVLGPANSAALLVFLVAGTALVVRSLRRLNRAELVEAVPLALVLAAPLAFAVFSANVQLPLEVADAQSHSNIPARQTLWAMAIQRSILTQLYGGVMVGALAFSLLVGALGLTVPGERPRSALGQVAAVLAAGFLLVLAVGTSAEPNWLFVARTTLYGTALVCVVMALVGAHRRGPGVQLAVVSAIAFPLLVAGIDQATIAWTTGIQLEAVALAPATERPALMEAALANLGTLRGFSGAHLGLATGLALLGPLAAWRSDRPLAHQNLAALGAVVVLAATGVGYASTWLLGF